MINIEALNKAGIDYAAGVKRFMGDAELYEAVLASFAKETIVQRARSAFQTREFDNLLKIAHEAKGCAGNAGLNQVQCAAGELVALLRQDSYTLDELAARYCGFERAYLEAESGIRAALRQ